LLVPSEDQDDQLWVRAREAVARSDRCEAARLMAEATAGLIAQTDQDHEFLNGVRRGFLALARQSVDLENLRLGLIDVVRQVRARQRFGGIPPAARSSLELLILILSSDDNEARESVLAELLEALADAGLSEVDLPVSGGLPHVAEAELAEKAKLFPLWPDLRACVDGLDGSFALLARRIGGGRSSAERWLTVFISPPSGAVLKSALLDARSASVLDGLNPLSGPVTDLEQSELDDLVHGFLHRKAVELLTAEPTRGLVVIPDGPLWNVPWQAASVLRSRPTTIAPSMTLYSGLQKPPAGIRSVAALLDLTVQGAELVRSTLSKAHDRGALEVSFDQSALDQECDLLIVLAHGTGNGLPFRINVGDGVTAHELAHRSKARSALVACCGSARNPPVALPINLPVSLLMRGCTQCVGGMWLLPQAPTSRLVATTMTRIAAGDSLTKALATARDGSTYLLDDWGLTAAGSL
jgi:hypothetical protein